MTTECPEQLVVLEAIGVWINKRDDVTTSADCPLCAKYNKREYRSHNTRRGSPTCKNCPLYDYLDGVCYDKLSLIDKAESAVYTNKPSARKLCNQMIDLGFELYWMLEED